jgi:hypothetical protein
MRAYVLALAMIAGLALADTPTKPVQNQASAAYGAPKHEQRGTKDAPLFVEGLVTTQRSEDEAQRQADEGKDKAAVDERVARYTGFSAGFTLLLFLASALRLACSPGNCNLSRTASKIRPLLRMPPSCPLTPPN